MDEGLKELLTQLLGTVDGPAALDIVMDAAESKIYAIVAKTETQIDDSVAALLVPLARREAGEWFVGFWAELTGEQLSLNE